jgi:hypothetical protein
VHFIRGVGQAVRVDVDANAATRTFHVLTGLQTPNALLKVMTAARTLKFDHVSIDVRHQSLSFARSNFRRLVLRRGRAAYSLTPNDQSGVTRCEGVVFALRVEQGKLLRPSALFGVYARSLRFAVGNTVQQVAPSVHSRMPEN